MALLRRGFLLAAGAGSLAVPMLFSVGSPPQAYGTTSARPDAPVGRPAASPMDVPAYATDQKEAYLSESQIDFIRPGMKATILAVTDFAPGKKPKVEFTLTDDLNQPLDRLGAITPGAVLFRFVPSTWDAAANQYRCLIYRASDGRADRDTAGTFEDLAVGHYRYTFSLALVDFDTSKPATVLLSGRRQTLDYLGKEYWANAFKDFVPASGAAASTWAVSTTAKCNTCHDPMTAHGGYFRELKTCAMCHNPASQTGRWVEFGEGFIHSLHMGNNDEVGPITYPQDMRHCESCHDSQSAQGSLWKTRPTRHSCGGCHLDVDWVTGAHHEAGPQASDAECSTCHLPEGEGEFDASVTGAHTLPYRSKQLKGLKAEIVSVDEAGPGKKPVLRFKLTNGDGSVVDPTKMGALTPVMGGPTSDYSSYVRENGATARVAFDGTNGTYTFTAAMPANASGTWTFSLYGYRNVSLQKADGDEDLPFQETFLGPIRYVALNGGAAVPRRTVVTQAACERCHARFEVHGGNRQSVQACVICHNPLKDDSADRVPATDTPESISFQRMIHRIHTGEELAEEYAVFEDDEKHSFNDVTYSGDRRNCLGCHSANNYQLPPPKGALSVITKRDFFTPQDPGTAACLGCHDSKGVASHALLNTSQLGESCEVCHGLNSEWSVAKSHAR